MSEQEGVESDRLAVGREMRPYVPGNQGYAALKRLAEKAAGRDAAQVKATELEAQLEMLMDGFNVVIGDRDAAGVALDLTAEEVRELRAELDNVRRGWQLQTAEWAIMRDEWRAEVARLTEALRQLVNDVDNMLALDNFNNEDHIRLQGQLKRARAALSPDSSEGEA